jgi:hypothetical protein
MMTAYYLFFAGKASTVTEFLTAYETLMNNLSKSYPLFAKNRYILFSPKGTLPVFAIGVKVFIVLHKLRLMGLFARLYCRR